MAKRLKTSMKEDAFFLPTAFYTFLFSEAEELKIHPSLFLLLLILGRLYPSPMDGSHSALSTAPFVPFIIR